MTTRSMLAALAGLVAVGTTTGLISVANASAAPSPTLDRAGARIQVTPNPVAPGQEITITGSCGGGPRVAYIGNAPGHPYPLDGAVRIVKDDPDGFVAKARVAANLGDGAGPVVVDCVTTRAETILVTHV
ncbi:MAG: hypothetical protein JOZ47_10310 [Kutzneria sp.]|nr:hypothetical protein [Kutzneria sp.]MBV9845452.1 hypothetical protein [Kutzneria sp.]